MTKLEHIRQKSKKFKYNKSKVLKAGDRFFVCKK